MEAPKISTTDGGKAVVTVLSDALLVDAYLSAATNSDDVDLVRLLQYAEPEAEKAGAILRRCLEGGKRLIAIYPGNSEKPPKGATLIGSISDGSLYLL